MPSLCIYSRSRRTFVVKTGSDSSNAKRSATGVDGTGPSDETIKTEVSCQSRCGTIKKLHCPMVVSVVHRFFTGNGDIYIRGKNSREEKQQKQTNKQTNKFNQYISSLQ